MALWVLDPLPLRLAGIQDPWANHTLVILKAITLAVAAPVVVSIPIQQ